MVFSATLLTHSYVGVLQSLHTCAWCCHNGLCWALGVPFLTATHHVQQTGVYLLKKHQVAQGAAMCLHQDVCMGDCEDLLLYG